MPYFPLTAARLNAGLQPNSFPLPENADVIMSADIAKIVAKKFELKKWEGLEHLESLHSLLSPERELAEPWEFPENAQFYEWLLK